MQRAAPGSSPLSAVSCGWRATARCKTSAQATAAASRLREACSVVAAGDGGGGDDNDGARCLRRSSRRAESIARQQRSASASSTSLELRAAGPCTSSSPSAAAAALVTAFLVRMDSSFTSHLGPGETSSRQCSQGTEGGDVSARAHTLAASGRWVAFAPSEDERLGTRWCEGAGLNTWRVSHLILHGDGLYLCVCPTIDPSRRPSMNSQFTHTFHGDHLISKNGPWTKL